ncbi:MAG TPA: class II aldolase/adducin family protein [Aggregatilineaceae bacterium]|nr:class II aldolase/adducin family protein [Aggregatilineaceae bacterium]
MSSDDSVFFTPTDEAVEAARARIAYFGRLLFDRHLTDAAGGNVSVRVGNRVCISPRFSGSHRQWQLDPDDVLVADLDRNILKGSGQLSRESNVHFKLHREFGEAGTAVIHAHSRNILVFAAAACSMPPVLEATLKFGVTPAIEYAPAHHIKLAENVADSLRGREDRIKNQAAAVIAPWHGLFLMGKDINAAFDAVERMDTNAYCILMGRLLVGSDAQARNEQMLVDSVNSFKAPTR